MQYGALNYLFIICSILRIKFILCHTESVFSEESAYTDKKKSSKMKNKQDSKLKIKQE